MSKYSYSVAKRGKNYYLRHRITPDGRQVQVSLRTNEQRDAYRRAKQRVIAAVANVAAAEQSQEIGEWDERYKNADEATQEGMFAEWWQQLCAHHDAAQEANRKQRDQLQGARRAKEQKRQAQLEEEQRNLTNPRIDAFWKLGDKPEDDTGLFVAWCRDGNRSRNTLIAYRTVWRRFRHYFPNLERMSDITPKTIKTFQVKCRQTTKTGPKPVSQAGVTQYLISLQGMFAAAIKEGWWDAENPVNVGWQHRRDKVAKFLTKEEADRLLKEAKALDEATYLFIAVAVHTGMRRDEVVNLRWEDIDFERKLVTLQAKKADPIKGIQEFQLKSKKARIIPLREALADILKPHKKAEGYIINSRSGREMKRTRWTPPAYFGVAQEKAGVKCNPHMLRHTFASWAAMQGVSIYKISEWLGHSTVQLTQDTYAHLQSYDADIDRF